ncbi:BRASSINOSTEROID INSENSITIVE 1-associated receptor kinase 1 precursor, putative [Ricinus communis]|uniref:non-specific serine/threonine protein kinase n=1 Tax=Ricinus communis TaxID=3988 RepID=B9RQ88_RICCO|nr:BRASSINOSTEROID INSENSITIVE 1-associated receptor kinase 1 precursor, putative [Ricinus communis]|eukprot:XP_002515907.3 LRR receptor-like serine/threonine-protein kinase IOS1 [Ricinus communis]
MMANKRLSNFLFRFLPILALAILVHCQDQSGFISIDCGLPANSSYTDATTGLNYVSDAAFIDTGIINNLAPGLNTSSIDRQQLSVRSFPEGDRNCYQVELTRGTKYLIRAIFLYRNYDGLSKLPHFDLHLGPNKWITVKILNATIPVITEIIYTPILNYIHVCLVNTGLGTPFISALELRPLKNTTYEIRSEGALAKFARLDFGSVTNKTVRYPDDVYDRIWTPDHYYKWTDLSTPETIDAQFHNDFQPPSIVMSTANVPTNASEDMQFFIDNEDTSLQFYFYMHFAEIVKLEANQSRQFNISLNGTIFFGPVIPDYLYTSSVYNGLPINAGSNVFSLFKIGGSTLPPLLNAIEIYFFVDLSQSQTDQDDVDAITKIKSTYGITRNWQGDACAPQAYVWQGLNCSYSDNDPPKITSLNLSSSGLTGEIVSDIANLKSLEFLDLSNNSLSGPVPDFLSQMPSLKVLNLTGNKLTGRIPVDLFERTQKGSLLLSVSGNPELCPSVSCKKKEKSIAVPVVASVASVFILAAAVAVILRYRILRSVSETGETKLSHESNEPMELKNKQFTYSEVLKITNNFEKVLGKGGFGTVYYGTLADGTQVAVKILSQSSVQGYKEFLAEVKLLMRVHHRNLTTLVGCCIEGTNMGLIYEYMANGNLEDYLSGSNLNTLSWEARLRIALEAGQGLEYLHGGCKLPIVHRDVKTTNILLNDKFQAKISDFGLSRIFPADGGTHVSTIVAGTPGYLDPEYYVTNWLTDKSDVYSFGVVLLEIITCRPVIAQNRNHENSHISQWVSSMIENGDVNSIADPRLNGEYEVNSVWKIVELAMECLSTTSARRPTMNQVVIELNECLKTEMARTREGQSTQSYYSIELVTVNVDTESSPLAR